MGEPAAAAIGRLIERDPVALAGRTAVTAPLMDDMPDARPMGALWAMPSFAEVRGSPAIVAAPVDVP